MHLRPDYQREEPIEGGTPTFALRGVPLAGLFITFSLCLSVARIDTPPLQPAALAFVSYGFVLVRVRVRVNPAAQTPWCNGAALLCGRLQIYYEGSIISAWWRCDGALLYYDTCVIT